MIFQILDKMDFAHLVGNIKRSKINCLKALNAKEIDKEVVRNDRARKNHVELHQQNAG